MGQTDPVSEAAATIRAAWNHRPRAGIILGTGLGRFADEVCKATNLPFASIPHFRRATADGHRGQLVCGDVAGLPAVVMDGRLHAYEGCSFDEITLPVRVMHALGIGLLIVTNAAGGLNPTYQPGDIMIVDDHINLMCATAGLPSSAVERAASSPYDPDLVDQALEIARHGNFVAHRGVYIAVAGPNYETRAEYRFLRAIGGDAVGMSTVPEILAANHLGLQVLALSTITNLGLSDAPHKTSSEEVVAAAGSAEPRIRRILLEVLARVTTDVTRHALSS